jgi:hypothetical protein
MAAVDPFRYLCILEDAQQILWKGTVEVKASNLGEAQKSLESAVLSRPEGRGKSGLKAKLLVKISV